MKQIIIVCGLPRSGTTAIYDVLRGAYPSFVASPDESTLLRSRASIKGMRNILEDYFESYLIENRSDRYSPYGVRSQFVENALKVILGSLPALCYRDCIEGATIGDQYLGKMAAYRSHRLRTLIDGDLILKCPLAELNWMDIVSGFSEHKVCFVYCLRELPKVFDSAVEKLRWYRAEEFAQDCLFSFEACLEMVGAGSIDVVPVQVGALGDLAYREQFLTAAGGDSSSIQVGVGSRDAIRENSASHMAFDYPLHWSPDLIASLPKGVRCLEWYSKVCEFHDSFYANSPRFPCDLPQEELSL